VRRKGKKLEVSEGGWEREREGGQYEWSRNVCVCVCVWERERECEWKKRSVQFDWERGKECVRESERVRGKEWRGGEAREIDNSNHFEDLKQTRK